MARHLFLAITLIGVGMLSNSRAEAVLRRAALPDNAADAIGRCVNPGGGTNDNKCMMSCDRVGTRCLIRAHEAPPAANWALTGSTLHIGIGGSQAVLPTMFPASRLVGYPAGPADVCLAGWTGNRAAAVQFP